MPLLRYLMLLSLIVWLGGVVFFFFRTRTNGIFGAAYTPPGRLRREPVTDGATLDWNCLGCRLPDDFDAVVSLTCGIGTAASSPSHSALHHARADVDLTIRYFAQDGDSARLDA
jgi:hypothetical protein